VIPSWFLLHELEEAGRWKKGTMTIVEGTMREENNHNLYFGSKTMSATTPVLHLWPAHGATQQRISRHKQTGKNLLKQLLGSYHAI
jgi:hypothetical protein